MTKTQLVNTKDVNPSYDILLHVDEAKRLYNLNMIRKQGKILVVVIISAFTINAQAQNIFENYSRKSIKQFISKNEDYQINSKQIQASNEIFIKSQIKQILCSLCIDKVAYNL